MKISIRSKLIVAISLLVVVLFISAAYLFINEKKREMAHDIYLNGLNFARLTAPSIVNNYDLYLAQNSFVYFNREMSSFFEQNDDVGSIAIVSYLGEILYDSALDIDKKYDGKDRKVLDSKMLSQVQSENISFKSKSGENIFLKENLVTESYDFVDKNEQKIESPGAGTLIDYFVVPANEKYSVIYRIDYHNLDERVGMMTKRIIYLALFGVMLGMIMSYFMSEQISRPVLTLVDQANKIAKGDFKSRVEIKTHDELSFLGDAFNKMAGELDASLKARVYKERVQHELDLASKIQQQIIPKEIQKVDGIDISAGLIPASEIGGDMYDFIKLDENRLLFYLGDVTGHGIPAGIVSSVANALFYGYVFDEPDLKNILVKVNRVLKAKTMRTMFMTLCLMLWDAANKKFFFASAGHEQIVHYKAGEGKSELLPAGGVALGMMEDISAHTSVNEVDFDSGDFLVIYSDGIPECWRSKNEAYGIERLKNFIAKNGNLKTAEEMKLAILKDVKDFAAGYEQMDDITIIVVRKN